MKLIYILLIILFLPVVYALDIDFGAYYYSTYYVDNNLIGGVHNSTISYNKDLKMFNQSTCGNNETICAFSTGYHNFTWVISTSSDMSNPIYNQTYTNGISNGLGNFTLIGLKVLINASDLAPDVNLTYPYILNRTDELFAVFYTRNVINSLVNNNITSLNNTISALYPRARDVQNSTQNNNTYVLSSSFNNSFPFANKNETTDIFAILVNYYRTNQVYNITQLNNSFLQISNMSIFYTRNQIDSSIIGNKSIMNISDYYTVNQTLNRTEINSAIIGNASVTNLTNVALVNQSNTFQRFNQTFNNSLYIDAENQRVGINTTTPSVALEVDVGNGNLDEVNSNKLKIIGANSPTLGLWTTSGHINSRNYEITAGFFESGDFVIIRGASKGAEPAIGTPEYFMINRLGNIILGNELSNVTGRTNTTASLGIPSNWWNRTYSMDNFFNNVNVNNNLTVRNMLAVGGSLTANNITTTNITVGHNLTANGTLYVRNNATIGVNLTISGLPCPVNNVITSNSLGNLYCTLVTFANLNETSLLGIGNIRALGFYPASETQNRSEINTNINQNITDLNKTVSALYPRAIDWQNSTQNNATYGRLNSSNTWNFLNIFSFNLTPQTNNTVDIGNITHRFANGWFNKIDALNVSTQRLTLGYNKTASLGGSSCMYNDGAYINIYASGCPI